MNRLRNQRIQTKANKCIKLGDYAEHWYKTYKLPKEVVLAVCRLEQ